MLRGLTTVTLFADDVTTAAQWYAELLGTQPYFTREVGGATAYAEFRVGDYEHELGIVDARFAPGRTAGATGPVTYWHVDDVEAAHARLLELGGQLGSREPCPALHDEQGGHEAVSAHASIFPPKVLIR